MRAVNNTPYIHQRKGSSTTAKEKKEVNTMGVRRVAGLT